MRCCFKEFNDTYGHAAGDRCLARFAEALKKFTENSRLDFYRYGGEEFVAMAYGYRREELFSFAEGLRIAVQNTDIDGHSITVGIGMAYCGGEQVPNYETVIDRADRVVYAAKRAGRNKVCAEPPEEPAT